MYPVGGTVGWQRPAASARPWPFPRPSSGGAGGSGSYGRGSGHRRPPHSAAPPPGPPPPPLVRPPCWTLGWSRPDGPITQRHGENLIPGVTTRSDSKVQCSANDHNAKEQEISLSKEKLIKGIRP